MSSILLPGMASDHPIQLQTRLGNNIENSQEHDFSITERNYFQMLDRKFPNANIRTPENPIYNCHGLTFASRRTRIWSSKAIRMILKDDSYIEVNLNQVKPGDVIIYLDEQGDFEHSGIIVDVDETHLLPRVVSKWGGYKEVIHWANQCPYDSFQMRFYRGM